MLKILVADDDLLLSESTPKQLISRLKDSGYTVRGVSALEEGIQLAQQEKWDIAIVDLNWPADRLGWEIVETLRADPKNAATKIILYSGFLKRDIIADAVAHRVIGVPKIRG